MNVTMEQVLMTVGRLQVENDVLRSQLRASRQELLAQVRRNGAPDGLDGPRLAEAETVEHE